MNNTSSFLSCLPILLLVLIFFYSAFCFAEDKAHSLSVQLDRSDDSIQIPLDYEDFPLESETVEVTYSFQYNELTVLSVSLLKGSDDGNGAIDIEKELSGFSGTASYLKNNWSWDLGFSVNKDKSELSATLPTRVLDSNLGSSDFDADYNEEYRSTDFFVGGSYDYLWQDFIFTPSLRLGHQTSELDSFLEGTKLTSSGSFDTKEESKGGYIVPTLSVAYLWTVSDRVLWLPSFSLFWSETMWGDVVSHSFFRFSRNEVATKSETKSTESIKSGSGLVSTSLMLVFDEFYTDLSFSQAMDTEPNSKSASLLLGLNF